METKKKKSLLFWILFWVTCGLLVGSLLTFLIFLRADYSRETETYRSWKVFEATEEVVTDFLEREEPDYKTYHVGMFEKEFYYPFKGTYFMKDHSVVIMKKEVDGKDTYLLLYDDEYLDNPYCEMEIKKATLSYELEGNKEIASIVIRDEEIVSSLWSSFLKTEAREILPADELTPFLPHGREEERVAVTLSKTRFLLCESKDGLVWRVDNWDGTKSFLVPCDADAFDVYVNFLSDFEIGGDPA